MAKVSVIIPVYNAEKYLDQCLESLCAQTLKEIEIICVDDGSTDGSPGILKKFQEKDNRIRILTQSNLYAGAARNNGMKEASGEYLLFLDADDFFEDTLLEKTYLQGKEEQADIVLFGAKQYNEKTGKVSSAPWYLKKEFLPQEHPFSRTSPEVNVLGIATPAPWTKLFRREFVEKEHLSFQGLQNSNDVYFVLTAICLAERITYVDEELVFYRVGMKDSLQGSKHLKPLCFLEAYYGVYRELKARGIYKDVEQGFLNTFLSGCVHNLRTAADWETKRQICEKMTEPEFLETGLMDKPEEYFRRKEDLIFVKGMLAAYSWAEAYHHKSLPAETTLIKKGSTDSPVPKVSVVIPVYNVEKYVRECLDSIVGQTLKEIEIICVDDGSTDHSLDILKEYGEKDSRIFVMTQENRGASSARNHGVDLASGEYLYFMDGDDILEKDALEKLYGISEEKALDVLYFDGCSFFETEELKESKKNYLTYYTRTGDYSHVMTGPRMFYEMMRQDEYRVSPCLQFINAVYYKKENLRFREGIIAEDNIFTFQCIMPAVRVYHTKEVFFHRRVRSNSVMTADRKFNETYGFFAGYLAIEKVFRDKKSGMEEEAIEKLVELRLRLTRKLYHQLKPEDKFSFEAMDPQEKAYFTMLVKDYDEILCREEDLQGKYKQVCQDKKDRGVEIRTLRREKQERGNEIRRLRGEKQECEQEIRHQKQEINKLEKEREKLLKEKEGLEKKMDSLKASYSYRLGRGLTKPFRWIYGTFKK